MLQWVLKPLTFAASLCCRQKALLELHSVSGQLFACVLSEALVLSLSVCTTLAQSTHWRTCCHLSRLSVFLCLSSVFQMEFFCLFVHMYFVSCICQCCPSLSLTCSLAWGIMQSYQKGMVCYACLCLHATHYSFQKLPFLLSDPQPQLLLVVTHIAKFVGFQDKLKQFFLATCLNAVIALCVYFFLINMIDL